MMTAFLVWVQAIGKCAEQELEKDHPSYRWEVLHMIWEWLLQTSVQRQIWKKRWKLQGRLFWSCALWLCPCLNLWLSGFWV